MDQNEKPVTLQLPKVAATWGSSSFKKNFLATLHETPEVLPLWDLCRFGTPSDEHKVSFTDLKFENQGAHKISGSFACAFTDIVGEGCNQNRKPFPIRSRLYFDFNLSSGRLDVHMPIRDFEA